MSESKHTPTPWKYDPNSGTVEGARHVHPQSFALGLGRTLKSAPVVCFVRGYHGSDEANANGSMIEAAPDMLDALRRVEFWLSTVRDSEAIAEVCRAAILKAEGRKS